MKKYAIGFIIGAMLMISTNAFASIGDSVTAVFSSFVYKVNGDTQTAETPVLVYEGMSYLRTTDLANMLGFDVTYKSDSRTIEFNNGSEAPVIPVTTDEPITPVVTTPPTIDPVTGEPVPSAVTPIGEEPVAEEDPVVEPEPDVVVEPDPTPTNAAACQAIRDSYTLQIFNLSSTHPNPAYVTWQTGILQSQRDAELSAAGC